MFKVASALLFAAVSIAPAQAATSIILNSGSTLLPSYTTAAVIQDFTTANANGSAFVPNSSNTAGVESAAPGAGGQNPGIVATTEVPALSGLTGDYLEIGRRATYTISFLASPVAFFSFAFNVTNPNNGSSTVGPNDTVTLTFADLTSQVLTGAAIFGNPVVPATFGRVSYDIGSGSKITSVEFLSRGGQPLRIDDIAVAAPEPAAWLMMILGFGVVGSQLRRRKGKVKVTFATA